MTLTWLIILLIYGLGSGWNIPALFWLLLIPMAVQETWNYSNRKD